MISAFLATYSSLRELEYKESMYGYNYYFSNTSDKRLVIKKSNKTSISEEEFKSIESLKGVDYIEKDDILLDTSFNVNDDDFYFWGSLESANNITSVDYGRLPKEANEVVVSGYKYDYYLTDNQDKLFEAKLNIYSDNGTAAYQNVKVVGIILNDDNEYSGSDIFYVKDELINELRLSINSSYSKIKININNMMHNSDYGYLNVIPNKNVKKGEVLFPDNLNYLCSYAWCLNKDISINISNLYYDVVC